MGEAKNGPQLGSRDSGAAAENQRPVVLLPWKNPKVLSRYRRRRILDRLTAGLAVTSLLLILYPLAHILYTFAYRGALAISIPRLTELSLDGGLANLIVGTTSLVLIAACFSIPVGVLGGIYLAEFSGSGKYAGVVRFFADVLAGMPSIIVGYVGFLILVLYFGWGFSVLAGSVTLGVLMLPYIMRTTEISIRNVPASVREAAEALGSTKTQLINKLTFNLALPGIMTGILLSVGTAMGETAPLLYTASNSNYYPCGLTNCPVGYLTYIIYTIINVSSTEAQELAYLSSFLLVSFVVSINFIARIGLKRFSRI
ncbi:MAG TPA: phosphate ABC transporter permease PstA [Candidatus Bathyarchaeia archaeon]|jgi:phosphate transport system permease protein|nr:phosphate ABC transporter permease PstA [Candidatus Bathyarchaeia archaeon]